MRFRNPSEVQTALLDVKLSFLKAPALIKPKPRDHEQPKTYTNPETPSLDTGTPNHVATV